MKSLSVKQFYLKRAAACHSVDAVMLVFITPQVALEGLGDLVGQVQLMGGLKRVWFVSRDSENPSAPAWLSVGEEPPL